MMCDARSAMIWGSVDGNGYGGVGRWCGSGDGGKKK